MRKSDQVCVAKEGVRARKRGKGEGWKDSVGCRLSGEDWYGMFLSGERGWCLDAKTVIQITKVKKMVRLTTRREKERASGDE